LVALSLVWASFAAGPHAAWAQGAASATVPTGVTSPASGAVLPPSAQAAAVAGETTPSPGLDLRAEPQAQPQPSLFKRWWFWTAVGAAAAATVAVIVISSRGQAPPATDLGNQEFQP
jgi:hypothetical protein